MNIDNKLKHCTFVDEHELSMLDESSDRICQNKLSVADKNLQLQMTIVIQVKQLNGHRFDSMYLTRNVKIINK